jgi:hypothetical protein
MATTENIRSQLKDYPEIKSLVKEITEYFISVKCHSDKFNNAIDHAVTFFFEWVFASMFKGIPGHARGSAHKIGQCFLPQTSFLELDRVYICYVTSHVKFGRKISPSTKVMG